jgi:hypothetical protein
MARGIDREPMPPANRVGIALAANAMQSYVSTGDWRAPYVRALLIEVGAVPEIPTQIWADLHPPRRRARMRNDPECE